MKKEIEYVFYGVNGGCCLFPLADVQWLEKQRPSINTGLLGVQDGRITLYNAKNIVSKWVIKFK